MKKSDKKIENSLRRVLTDVCDIALDNVEGFKWLTHLVNYDCFPGSLSVICVFDTNSELADAKSSKNDNFLREVIKQKLESVDIKLSNINKHVRFDTEENCKREHGGKWSERLR